MTKRGCRGMGKDYHRGYRVSKNKFVPFFLALRTRLSPVRFVDCLEILERIRLDEFKACYF